MNTRAHGSQLTTRLHTLKMCATKHLARAMFGLSAPLLLQWSGEKLALIAFEVGVQEDNVTVTAHCPCMGNFFFRLCCCSGAQLIRSPSMQSDWVCRKTMPQWRRCRKILSLTVTEHGSARSNIHLEPVQTSSEASATLQACHHLL